MRGELVWGKCIAMYSRLVHSKIVVKMCMKVLQSVIKMRTKVYQCVVELHKAQQSVVKKV